MRIIAALALALSALAPSAALAWSDEGHEIVALIADHYLQPSVRDKVVAMLAADPDRLTKHDLASEATWADKYRDSDLRTTKKRYNQTYNWHFVYTGQPCTGHSPARLGTAAAAGPAKDCIIDKIDQFTAELADPATAAKERLLALKYLLNLVADLHQPVRASDRDGSVRVVAEGMKPGTLLHYWDEEFVARNGTDPQKQAQMLLAQITAGEAGGWTRGAPENWAEESFELAKSQAFGKLPAPDAKGVSRLDGAYVIEASQIVASQLSKAGVRLAAILNRALGGTS